MNHQSPLEPAAPSAVDPSVRQPRRKGETPVALRNAGVFMAVVIGGFTLKALSAILPPPIIAVFMLLLIDGVSRTMAQRFPNWPQWVRTMVGVVVTVVGFTGVVIICAYYGRPFAAQVRVLQPRIDGLLGLVSHQFNLAPMTLGDLFQGGSPANTVSRVIGAARGVISEAVLVMIYLGFLVASRQAFGRKTARLFPGDLERSNAERVFNRVRIASEQYISLQTFKATLVATTAWVVMSLVGVSNALFIAFILFLASYVPIVGGIGGSIVPALIALAQFESPVRPIVLIASLGASIFMIENVLMPKLQSDRLNLDPVFILLSLGFWGVILGLPGVLLSTPLTVVVMAIAAEFRGTRWLAILLSKDGEPAILDDEL